MMFQRGLAVCFLYLVVCGITSNGEHFVRIYILGRWLCCEIVEGFGRGWCFAGFGSGGHRGGGEAVKMRRQG